MPWASHINVILGFCQIEISVIPWHSQPPLDITHRNFEEIQPETEPHDGTALQNQSPAAQVHGGLIKFH